MYKHCEQAINEYHLPLTLIDPQYWLWLVFQEHACLEEQAADD